jgi:hypothetical protein
MDTPNVPQDLPEANKEVVATRDADDLAGRISQEFSDDINLVISEERPESAIVKVKSQVPTYKDWIERRFYLNDYGKEFTKIAGVGFHRFARQFGIYLKRGNISKPEYIKLGKLIYKDKGSNERAFRVNIISKIKSFIPTYRDWVNCEFYARNGKEFTKMMGSGFIIIARQFGLDMRIPGRLNKAEYLKLGRIIYENKEVEALNE